MALGMVLVKLCLVWLFLQEQSILTDTNITVYTIEGSTINIPLKDIGHEIYCQFNKKTVYSRMVRTKKYDILLCPDFQMINVTTNDTGLYRFHDRGLLSKSYLQVTNTSCRAIDYDCAIDGSSSTITFIIKGPVYYSTIKEGPYRGSQSRKFSNFTIHLDLHINNVTPEDEGIYGCQMHDFGRINLHVVNAPAVTVQYTNGTIECDCDGVPPIYNVYRLDQISNNGDVVRSVNLKTETFTLHTDPFPYQRNGRYMCVASNGIPDTNGNVPQNWSTNVNYEGPPVFAKENRYVKIGKVGQSSIRMSFHVYSCPDVEEIFLEKLGRMRGKKRKINKYFLKSTLLYNEFDNKAGIPGYDILIESEERATDDVQAYCITVKNRLGASDYHFEIIKKEDRVINQRKRTYFVPVCILGAVLFGSILVHVGCCLNLIRPRVQIHDNVHEDRTHHTYDEIRTISYGAVSNIRSSDTNDTQGHAAHISNETIVPLTDGRSNELNADFHNDDLPQREVTDVQGQHRPISMIETNIINKEQSSDQNSQTSNESESETSNNVMVGNVGDGYENPYETVTQDRLESHQYIHITRERNTSLSSAESNCEEQITEKSLTKEAGYINLQL